MRALAAFEPRLPSGVRSLRGVVRRGAEIRLSDGGKVILVRRLITAGTVLALALPAAATADVLISKSRNTWCEYQPGGAIRVQCTAGDWHDSNARKTFVLGSTGKAAVRRLTGDPGDGITVPYDRWIYFRG